MSLHKNSKKWQNKQNGATSWMLKAIKKWIWMLFWVELLKFMMLPTCQSNFFFKFQKFTFFEFPNHDGHSTALCVRVSYYPLLAWIALITTFICVKFDLCNYILEFLFEYMLIATIYIVLMFCKSPFKFKSL